MSAADERRPALWIAAAAVTLGACYALALAASALLLATSAPPRKPHMLLDPGLYVPDPEIGYRLAPSWQGLLHDGVLALPAATNRYGQRDDEPEAMTAPRRVLLLGDSFAFGFALAQDETVDRQIERLSRGGMDVYNAGVVGYGPPAVLETFRRCAFVSPRDVIYLFFQNDLQDDALHPAGAFVWTDGYLLPRLRPDGTPHRPEDFAGFLRDRLALLAPPSSAGALRAAVGLAPLRERLRTLADAIGPREPADEDLLEGVRATYRAANVERALAYTDAMERLARERAARFGVVVVPSRAEARWQRDARVTAAFVAGLRARGTPVLALRPRLATRDYHAHDAHWSPQGARTAAAAILAWLETGSG